MKFKLTGLLLVFFICFIGINGFGQSDDGQGTVSVSRMDGDGVTAHGYDSGETYMGSAEESVEPYAGTSFVQVTDTSYQAAPRQAEVAGTSAAQQRPHAFKRPLNGKLFEEVLNSGVHFKNLNLNYYLSSPLSLELIPNMEQSPFVDNNGILSRGGRHNPAEATGININIDESGILQDIFTAPAVTKGAEVFEVLFREKRALLTFRRNMQQDRFDLVAVMTTNDLKKYHPSGRVIPHLVILYDDRNDQDMVTVPARQLPVAYNIVQSTPSESQPVSRQNITNVDNTKTENTRRDALPNGVIRIEGRGTLTNQRAIVDYIIKNENNAISRAYLEILITTYFLESEFVQINPDVAIAQMCHVTQFLRNRELVLSNNFAGFAPLSNSDTVRFNTMSEGVRAHVQHLKAYASVSYNPQRSEIVDPRWDSLRSFRGSATTLDELAARWSPHNQNYAHNIKRIIDAFHRTDVR